MKYAVTVVGGRNARELEIEPGESLEVPIDWQDAAGAPLVLDGASVTFQLFDRNGVQVYRLDLLLNPALLAVSGATTALWPVGLYHAELWATDVAGRVGAASFPLRVSQ